MLMAVNSVKNVDLWEIITCRTHMSIVREPSRKREDHRRKTVLYSSLIERLTDFQSLCYGLIILCVVTSGTCASRTQVAAGTNISANIIDLEFLSHLNSKNCRT